MQTCTYLIDVGTGSMTNLTKRDKQICERKINILFAYGTIQFRAGCFEIVHIAESVSFQCFEKKAAKVREKQLLFSNFEESKV